MKVQQLAQFQQKVISCVEIEDKLHLLTINGELICINKSQKQQLLYDFGNQPQGMTQDPVEKNIFVADLALQSIFVYQSTNNDSRHEILVKDFEGIPLLGPNSLIMSQNNFCLYFTDSGPFGHTSLLNPIGSIFMIDLSAMVLKPLCLNKLAYPSGLALSNDEKILYVNETCANRVLRYVLTEQGTYLQNLFYQFSGRFGPSAITISETQLIYVARFEFSYVNPDGVISVLNQNGQLVENIAVPGVSEISCLQFSKSQSYNLFICDNSKNVYKAHVALEDKREKNKN